MTRPLFLMIFFASVYFLLVTSGTLMAKCAETVEPVFTMLLAAGNC